MNLDMYKDEKLLIITPNTTKINLLKESNNIINVKFMTKEEFIGHYLFTWNNKTIDYLITNYNYLMFMIGQANGTTSANSVAFIDGLIVVDLTAAFGSGKEPSQGWCDSNINYFNGTTTVYY